MQLRGPHIVGPVFRSLSTFQNCAENVSTASWMFAWNLFHLVANEPFYTVLFIGTYIAFMQFAVACLAHFLDKSYTLRPR